MRLWATVLVCFALTGCGSIYVSPDVVEEETVGGQVTVTPITSETLATANRSDYHPRALPTMFSRTAGVGSGLRGAGALPDPVASPETRPSAQQTKLPPVYTNGVYRIGIGDVVLLATSASGSTVKELTGLLAAQSKRQGYTVQDDGAIAIPDVGRVEIAGMTVSEAEADLFRVLVENQIDPTFSLEISEFNSQRVSVAGAVANPSVLSITLTSLRLHEVLAAAGGVTAPDQDYVTIRIYRDGEMYQIPLTTYLGDVAVQNTNLKPGDTVFIDTDFDLEKAQAYFEEQIRLKEFRLASRAQALSQLKSEIEILRTDYEETRQNFQARVELDAVQRDYVYITGEVGSQARYTLPFERKAVLADALFDRGEGVDSTTGNVSEIYVLRSNSSGPGVTAWHLDARNVANLVLATRFELRPSDIVFVAEQPVTVWGRVVKQITPSLLTSSIGAVTD